MDNLDTVDSILEWFKEIAAKNDPIDPHILVNNAFKLNSLSSNETDKLFDLQQVVAQKRFNLINGGDNVSRARAKVEASDDYREFNKQKAKVDRVEETIRLAKLMSRIKDNEYRNG